VLLHLLAMDSNLCGATDSWLAPAASTPDLPL
jgi:hypothetical protein